MHGSTYRRSRSRTRSFPYHRPLSASAIHIVNVLADRDATLDDANTLRAFCDPTELDRASEALRTARRMAGRAVIS
jgi:hypothetical protein